MAKLFFRERHLKIIFFQCFHCEDGLFQFFNELSHTPPSRPPQQSFADYIKHIKALKNGTNLALSETLTLDCLTSEDNLICIF